ncbi:MAG TPA: hypothetical protein VFF63_04745 [Candidatus Babeliales bacterium]|nr:hypothetical protein [Candidatus Babeliales bacterium]
MRRFSFCCSAFAGALLVTACNGGNVNAPAGGTTTPTTQSYLPDAGIARPKFLRLMHTPPFPPPRRHKITSTDRRRAAAGGWQQVSSVPSFTNGPATQLLMTDGTVIVQDFCTSNWYRLTPDQNGNYLTGTWSEIAAMPSNYAPLYFASAVLADAKVVVNGGEYNGLSCSAVESNLGAIYDPFTNSWTAVSPPSGWGHIGDGQSVVLDNGTYMLGNCCYDYQALFNESALTWTQTGPGNGKQDSNSEEGWTLLRGGDVLVVNVSDPPYAQYYSPKLNMWESAGQLPENIITGFEIGPQTLRPDDTVFVAGATGATVVYHAKTGSWTNGPTFPTCCGSGSKAEQLDVADGPSAMLTNGTVMIPASPGLYNSPTYYFIFNGTTLTQIAAPPNAVNDSTYNTRLLLLPNGQILETDGSSDIEIYTANVPADPRGRPRITSVATSLSPGSTYKIKGVLFNGVSQVNMYGDDVQEATNYPLVRITNTASGQVFYCRTHNHSFMGVGSDRGVSTMFDVPSTIQTGASSLVVVANGIASSPVSVTIQ